MVKLTLRDKTNQKFKSFFEKTSEMHQGEEFELAFSDIQRETGAANITMKRAIESLVTEGWLEVKPGRNSRYAWFKLASQKSETVGKSEAKEETEQFQSTPEEKLELEDSSGKDTNQWVTYMKELEGLVESLRRRLRTQEMTIALLQDRVAEIEDKLYRR